MNGTYSRQRRVGERVERGARPVERAPSGRARGRAQKAAILPWWCSQACGARSGKRAIERRMPTNGSAQARPSARAVELRREPPSGPARGRRRGAGALGHRFRRWIVDGGPALKGTRARGRREPSAGMRRDGCELGGRHDDGCGFGPVGAAGVRVPSRRVNDGLAQEGGITISEVRRRPSSERSGRFSDDLSAAKKTWKNLAFAHERTRRGLDRRSRHPGLRRAEEHGKLTQPRPRHGAGDGQADQGRRARGPSSSAPWRLRLRRERARPQGLSPRRRHLRAAGDRREDRPQPPDGDARPSCDAPQPAEDAPAGAKGKEGRGR